MVRSGDEWGGELELFGRDAERVAVGRLLEGARGGLAGLLLVGDAGIGKTSLLLAGVAQSRSSGFRVLLARPGRFERELTFAALGDLLDPVFDEVCDLLPEPQRDALAVALLRASGGVPLDQRAVSVAVLGALRVLASRRCWWWWMTCNGWILRPLGPWSLRCAGCGGSLLACWQAQGSAS